jgi:adenylate cyclase
MFAFSDPSAACQLALDLVARSPNPVRAGLAHGVVVALHGDYYGPTVNLAARLVSVASPSTIVVSESVHDASAAPFAFEPFETGPLRGFPDVTTAFHVQGLRA